MTDSSESLARLKAVLETAVSAIITIDDRGTIDGVNPACERLFGYDAGAMIGRNVRMLMPESFAAEHDGYLGRYLATGVRRILGIGREVDGKRRDGSVFPIHLAVSEFAIDGERRFTGVITDISERKRIESELERRLHQQETVAELGERAIARSDLGELMGEATRRVAETLEVELVKILELQPGGESLLLRAGVGWAPGLVGSAMVEAGAESQAGYTLSTSAPVTVPDLRRETRFRGPDLLLEHGVRSGLSVVILGGERPFGVLGAHTRSLRAFSQGDVNFLQSVANVIAEAVRQRHARETLLQQENLVRLGELAAVVAHEVKNTQAGVSGALRVISRRLPQDSDDQSVIEDMLKRLEMLNRFMGDVLTFARPSMPQLVELPLMWLVEDTIALLGEDPRFGDVEVRAAGEPVRVPCDAEMLRPVLVNLLVNAAEAMPAGGVIDVSVTVGETVGGMSCCRIVVADDGPGMVPETLARVFEPFFSTKRRGSGLGLPIAKRVVELHGGAIRISSPTSGGTRAVIELPLRPADAR